MTDGGNMRRIAVGVGLVLGLVSVPGAQAQVTTGTCKERALRAAECGTVAVPLDHDDAASAKLPLAFARFPARAERRGTIVFLAGGPGQASIPLADSVANGTLRSLRRRYDLVFVDQRGAGRSAPLRCSTAPRGTFRVSSTASASRIAATVAKCAAELGPTRRFFSTYQTAHDLESLRVLLGVEQIIPLGVSYGGQVAGEYARRYPSRTQALILDSTGPIEGGDLLGQLPQLALPRVLRETCFPPGCEKILGDPQRLLSRAVDRIGTRGLRGRMVTAAGRRRSATIGIADLYSLIRLSDTDPALRMAIPAALEAAGRGDAAPLLRLAYSGTTGGGEPPESERINEVRLLATNCMEGRLPWATDSDPATRPALLDQALAADSARYAPFPVEAVLQTLDATFCLGWPATPRPPVAGSRGPDVPVLILGGRADLRTPLEDQRRAGLQYPHATVVGVPGVGHSVLGSDVSGCAADAITAFLFERRRRACPRADIVPLALPVFTSLADVPGAAGTAPPRVERTLVAVDMTLRDAARQIIGAGLGGSSSAGAIEGRTMRIGGLRGGRIDLRRTSLTLRDYEVVTGVRVSGRLNADFAGTITVTGAGADGTLRVLKSGTLRGTLAGTTIRYRPLPVGS